MPGITSMKPVSVSIGPGDNLVGAMNVLYWKKRLLLVANENFLLVREPFLGANDGFFLARERFLVTRKGILRGGNFG